MATKEEVLASGHFVFVDFIQRMTTKSWKKILLDQNDTIVFRGHVITLKGKSIGCGVVEVSKTEKDIKKFNSSEEYCPR